MRDKQKGFSLIELLIVVAIILIIASIAIPNLLAARRQTNETAAVGAIRAINTAQISYNSAYPNVGYASTLAALGGTSCGPPSSASACLIDSQTASGHSGGLGWHFLQSAEFCECMLDRQSDRLRNEEWLHHHPVGVDRYSKFHLPGHCLAHDSQSDRSALLLLVFGWRAPCLDVGHRRVRQQRSSTAVKKGTWHLALSQTGTRLSEVECLKLKGNG